ncbi:MAG: hypothetical protein P8H62_03975 [Henriciella sp.]|nr:hypothetical protein [Henriciella sp.]
MPHADSSFSLNPSSNFWLQPLVVEMFERSQTTLLGAKTKQWLEAETELSRLVERLNKLEAERGDKVMATVVRSKIAEQSERVQRCADEIADMPARNAVDVIWKLSVARDISIRMADENAPTAKLSTSALNDLLRFVKVKQGSRSAAP